MVSLLLIRRKWNVELIWEGDKCKFGKGWSVFARQCKLEEGDSLIFYRNPTEGVRTLNVVISKKDDETIQLSGGKTFIPISL